MANHDTFEAFAKLDSRLSAIETDLASLKNIEPSLAFFNSNLEFFKGLVLSLGPRLTMLEVSVTSGLPAMITQQATLDRTAVVQEASMLTDAALRPEIESIRKAVDSFRRDATKLWATKSDLDAKLSVSTPALSTKPKVPTPAVFSGKREDWKTFVSHLSIFFTANAGLYSAASDKILFAISRLGEGSAFKYMEQHIPKFGLPSIERPLIICDYDLFIKTMSENFGIQNAHVVAEAQLRSLRQKGSAMDYTNKFLELAAETDWNDAAKISQYRLGLKDTVQDMLALAEEPRSFSEFANKAIDIDKRQFARHMEKQQAQHVSRPFSGSTVTTPRQQPAATRSTPFPVNRPASLAPPQPSMAMDLGQVRHLSPEEKQQRKDSNACFYCGDSKHWSSKCPKKPSLASAAVDETSDHSYVFELGKDSA